MHLRISEGLHSWKFTVRLYQQMKDGLRFPTLHPGLVRLATNYRLELDQNAPVTLSDFISVACLWQQAEFSEWFTSGHGFGSERAYYTNYYARFYLAMKSALELDDRLLDIPLDPVLEELLHARLTCINFVGRDVHEGRTDNKIAETSGDDFQYEVDALRARQLTIDEVVLRMIPDYDDQICSYLGWTLKAGVVMGDLVGQCGHLSWPDYADQ